MQGRSNYRGLRYDPATQDQPSFQDFVGAIGGQIVDIDAGQLGSAIGTALGRTITSNCIAHYGETFQVIRNGQAFNGTRQLFCEVGPGLVVKLPSALPVESNVGRELWA